MKHLILIGDGMGDHPIADLQGRTPLEAAHTPMMDLLCQKGELFLTNTIPEGYPPGSDVANLSLLGYDPAKYYTGRAPLEAASMGITLAVDETAFRCNLVTLNFQENNPVEMVDFSAGHISSEEARQLILALEKECGNTTFHFTPGISYRHLLTVKGELPELKTAPPHDYIDKDVSKFWQSYFSHPDWAELLGKAKEVLTNHPVNLNRVKNGLLPATSIWPWGEGKTPNIPTLYSRFGITGSMISAVDLLKGLGIYAGLNIITVPGATGYIDTNYQGKAQAALNALAKEDFVFVHVEAPDEAGHQGLIKEKIQAIEDFDEKIVRYIIEGLLSRKEEFRAVVAMDHYTPISLRTHTNEPVPTLLYDSREQNKGSGKVFCEKSVNTKDDSILLQDGYKLINKLLETTCK